MNKICYLPIFICVLLFSCLEVNAQKTKSRFLKEAKEAFEVGDCERAARNYEMAVKLDNATDVNLKEEIDKCMEVTKATNEIQLKDSVFNCDYLDYYFYMDGVAMTYEMASNAAKKCSIGDCYCWRLPTKDELKLIIDYHVKQNVLYPAAIKEKDYWSSSESQFDCYTYRYGHFENINIQDINTSAYSIFVKDKKNGNANDTIIIKRVIKNTTTTTYE